MAKSTILIIDDETFFLDMLFDILTKKGYAVSKAATLEEGMGLIYTSKRFDLVFIDTTLPDMTGVGGIKKLRDTKLDMDIVVITSLDDAAMTAEFMKAGASDFLLKPYKGEELELILDRLLTRKDIEKDRDILLYENIEYIELLSLYRRIVRLVNVWELDKLKDLMLDELMNSTFGQGAVLYSFVDDNHDVLKMDFHKGIIDRSKVREELPKSVLDSPDMSFYLSIREMNIPLRFENKTYGFVKILDPLLQEGFTEKEFNTALHICEFISYALENAKRLELLQKTKIKDSRTQAYHWDVFRDFVKKEIYKTLRYDRKFSVMGVRIENLEELRGRYKEDIIDAALKEMGEAIYSVVRDSDWFVEIKPGDYMIFLTETDYFGALMAIRRVRQGLAGKCILKGERSIDEFRINLGAVGLPIHGTNLEGLLKTLQERLVSSKDSIFYNLDFNKNSFEQICSIIMTMKQTKDKQPELYKWSRKEGDYFNEWISLMANDVRFNTKRPGIMFAGFFDGKMMDFLEEKESFVDIVSKVYFFLAKNKDFFDIPGVVSVGAEKADFENIRFMLTLNEHYSYAYIETGQDVFETNDSLLIEALINKLQVEYYLQWQL